MLRWFANVFWLGLKELANSASYFACSVEMYSTIARIRARASDSATSLDTGGTLPPLRLEHLAPHGHLALSMHLNFQSAINDFVRTREWENTIVGCGQSRQISRWAL